MDARLETATTDGKGWHDHGVGPGSVHGHYVKWHTIEDPEGSVTEDVTRIRSHPLVPGAIAIHGYLYDVRTGSMIEVKTAASAGAR